MPSSLIKFSNWSKSSDGQNVFWSRASVDGIPFRGEQAPMFTDDEFDSRTVRVADARNAFFDVNDEKQNKKYLEVLECCFNQWFQLIHLERFWNNTTFHYVEWVEYYLEDGQRTPHVPLNMTEMPTHGQ